MAKAVTLQPKLNLREAEQYFKLRREQDRLAKEKDPKRRKTRKDKESAGGSATTRPERLGFCAWRALHSDHDGPPARTVSSNNVHRRRVRRARAFSAHSTKLLLIFCKSAVVTLYGRVQAGVGTIYTGIRTVTIHT